MLSFTLQRKLIQISQHLQRSPESGSPQSENALLERDALRAFPELSKLRGQVNATELYNRAKVLSRMKDIADNPGKAFGRIKSFFWGSETESIISDIRTVMRVLSTEKDVGKIASQIIETKFIGWDGVGDSNFRMIGSTRVTYRRFIGNLINDSQLVANLFSSSPKEETESSELTKKEIQERTRFGTFLVALETRYPSNEYKVMFRQAHEALGRNDISQVYNIVGKTLKEDWNIDVNSLATPQGHINALRAIKATDEAGLSSVREFRNISKHSDNEKKLVNEIGTNLEREKQRKQKEAANKYQNILNSLPGHAPEKSEYERNKDRMISQMQEDMAYLSIMDNFIKKNGSGGLGELGEVYDDMRGLYGVLNFTDENATMTKELAIMLGSFVITGGTGVLLRGIAVAGRAVAGAESLKSVDLANRANIVRNNLTRVSNMGRATLRHTGTATAKVAERLSTTGKIASSTKLGSVPVEAFKFTTADAALRSVFRSEGERSGFEDYFEKLGKNMLMFGAFAGVERKVSEPIKAKILSTLATRGISLNALSTYAVGTAVLTGGDVAVMWGMGMMEKGEFHFPEWKEVIQALSFRVGMKGVEAGLPKLVARFRKENPLESTSKETRTNETGHTVQRRSTRESMPDSTKVNQEIKDLKAGERVTFETTEGKRYTFEKQQNGEFKIIFPDNLGGTVCHNIDVTQDFKLDGSSLGRNIPIKREVFFQRKQASKVSQNTSEDLQPVGVVTNKIPTSNNQTRDGWGAQNMSKKPLQKVENTPSGGGEEVRIIQDFSQLKQGQEVQFVYNGTKESGTITSLNQNNDSVTIKIGENRIVSGPVNRIKIIDSSPPAKQNSVIETKNEVSNSHEEVHATEMEEFIRNAQKGDSKMYGDFQYQRINNGWKIHSKDTLLAKVAFTDGITISTEELLKLLRKKQEATIRVSAQDSINREHRIGEPALSARKSAETFAEGSFRAEMDIIMHLDDASFQKKFTEVQNRNTEGKEPKRKYEREMYDAAAKVRKLSGENIVSRARDIIKGNDNFLSTQHPNRDPSQVGLSDKAFMIAENAALRSRIRDMVSRETHPEIAEAVVSAAKSGKTAELENTLKKHILLWPIPITLATLIFGLSKLSGNVNATPPLPVTTDATPLTPYHIALYCARCAGGQTGDLDYTRRSVANKNVILTKERREDLSKKFMEKDRGWIEFIKEYAHLKDLLGNKNDTYTIDLIRKIQGVIEHPNAENVKQLQQCIGMSESVKSGNGTESLDHEGAQDGIIGPNTTRELRRTIKELTSKIDNP